MCVERTFAHARGNCEQSNLFTVAKLQFGPLPLPPFMNCKSNLQARGLELFKTDLSIPHLSMFYQVHIHS
jgi:hypothetical protein